MQRKYEKMYFKALSKTNIKIKVLVQIVGCWLLLFCFSCQSQPIDKVLSELPMNIDNVTNFRLEDDPAANPSYDYYDKKNWQPILLLILQVKQSRKKCIGMLITLQDIFLIIKA